MIPDYVREQAKLELARRSFWHYCKLKAPDFYMEERLFLKDMCTRLQEFYESDKKLLVVNLPPRHGKSRTATLFVQWVLGKDNRCKVMTGSYNENLSGTFAKQVRDAIAEENGLYNQIFPDTKIKYGEAAMSKWALKGNEEANYLATSPRGTATGFGCNLMIIDDLIKEAQEAYNENELLKQWEWFNNTMLQRTEQGFKIIIIMTRWASNDLAGQILANNKDAIHITYKAVQDDGSMLCEDILSREDFEFKTKEMNLEIAEANYNQRLIDVGGRLYPRLKTYTELPELQRIKSYTDTADTGKDYLCTIVYGEVNKEAYVLDIHFTDKGMEITEEETADILVRNNVNMADIESNNGGRGFARNVIRILKEKYGTNKIIIMPFTQTGNKEARILSSSNWVMEHVYFPHNWRDRFPEFYKHITSYQKKGKNIHDDGPDVLAGIYDKIDNKKQITLGFNKII
jgi:predicted phage terminase large subunit-like protein